MTDWAQYKVRRGDLEFWLSPGETTHPGDVHLDTRWVAAPTPKDAERVAREVEVLIPEDIIFAVAAEIKRANEIWRLGPDEAKRAPLEAQYGHWAPHLIVLEEKAARARRIWYDSHDEREMREQFVRLAAIAVRALMEAKPCP